MYLYAIDYLKLQVSELGTMIQMLPLLINKKHVHLFQVHLEYTSRRLLVTEWVDGTKLSLCPPDEIRRIIKIGKESYLRQVNLCEVILVFPRLLLLREKQ